MWRDGENWVRGKEGTATALKLEHAADRERLDFQILVGFCSICKGLTVAERDG